MQTNIYVCSTPAALAPKNAYRDCKASDGAFITKSSPSACGALSRVIRLGVAIICLSYPCLHSFSQSVDLPEYERQIAQPRSFSDVHSGYTVTIRRQNSAKKTDDQVHDSLASNLDPGAVYEMRMNRQVVWTLTLPFTLYAAHVCADGRVIGYAYESDIQGSPVRLDPGNESALCVAAITSHGELVWEERLPRGGMYVLSDPPRPALPVVVSMTVNEEENRIGLYMVNARAASDELKVVILDALTGHRTSENVFHPPKEYSESLWSLWQASPVPGTPFDFGCFIVTSSKRREGAPAHKITRDGVEVVISSEDNFESSRGCAFVVFDADGKAIWTSVHPGEYSTASGKGDEGKNVDPRRLGLLPVVADKSVCVPTGRGRAFAIRMNRNDATGNWVIDEERKSGCP